jgi:hypothetical protein
MMRPAVAPAQRQASKPKMPGATPRSVTRSGGVTTETSTGKPVSSTGVVKPPKPPTTGTAKQ